MMATGTGQTAGFWELAGELGSSWKAIARCLGFTEPQIENLLEDVPNCSHERCYKMLLQWQKKTHQYERKEQLRQALETAGRLDLIRLGARAEGLSSSLFYVNFSFMLQCDYLHDLSPCHKNTHTFIY